MTFLNHLCVPLGSSVLVALPPDRTAAAAHVRAEGFESIEAPFGPFAPEGVEWHWYVKHFAEEV